MPDGAGLSPGRDPPGEGRVSYRAFGWNFKRSLPSPYFWSSCSSRVLQSHHLAGCKAHRVLYLPVVSVTLECGNISLVHRFLGAGTTRPPEASELVILYWHCVCAFHCERASGFSLKHRTWLHEGSRIHKTLCNLRQEGVSVSVLTDVLRDPGEDWSSWGISINVKTTSTLPKLITSEGPVSRVSPNHIKGRLTVPSPVCLSALSKGLSLSSLGHSGPCRVSRVNGCCFGACLLLGPCLQPSSICSYPSHLRCKEDDSRALRCLLRSMWLYVKGPNSHTLWSLVPSHLPCRLFRNGTKLSVSCWDWLKRWDSGWPCCDIWTDWRTQPPQSGPVAWFVHV